MEEEEEDSLLLSSLGVKSANAEEFERSLLLHEAEADKKENQVHDGKDTENALDTPYSDLIKLHNKLRAVEVEIDAVAASVGGVGNKDISSISVENGQLGTVENIESENPVWTNGLELQHALAADRLKSLRKTRNQLQNEISEIEKEIPSDSLADKNLLGKLVKEKKKHKPKSEGSKLATSSNRKKQKKTITFDDDLDFDAVLDAASAGFVETERDELIRKGILTPFHKLKGFERGFQKPGPSNSQAGPSNSEATPEEVGEHNRKAASIAKAAASLSAISKSRPSTKLVDASGLPKLEPPTRAFHRLQKHSISRGAQVAEKPDVVQGTPVKKRKRPLPDKKWRKVTLQEEKLFSEEEGITEGHPSSSTRDSDSASPDYEVENQDGIVDHEPTTVTLEGGLKIPETVFNKLFDYQKVGVKWLWELHCQRAGGIIGDEMGLGKTVQVIAFLGALHFSKMYKPSIVICPVTLLCQWRREVKKWYPGFHVEILHDSVQLPGSRRKVRESDDESESMSDSETDNSVPAKNIKKWDALIDRITGSESGLLLTTYEQLRILREKLLDIEWGYAVLDEGHRIRNPNAEVTLVCKQLQTVHRIIMTGAPIQNKLTELWSLFDFVFPGKLGVLPVFEAQFSVPISVGGYANATPLQVSTAYRCAVVLRDLIMPYLLRRMKADVNAQLPKKTEHVLFCSLTMEQRAVYRAFLASSEVEQIFNGNRNSLYGIDVVRKICNHPDLLEREHSAGHPDYGNPERSGKMKVVAQVLKVWKDQGHRVLLFAQTQQMLDILESFLIASEYSYRRMDGLTPVKQRMVLMDEFNGSNDVFVFILTTKVGGLGTNLTGADRVIIFDPDWNPSTDVQARERAWRIGQTRDVTIYRLITRGTIEEKVYHRQIYKHFLTNKILKNPQQRRFFKARDMRDLFTLQEDADGACTETSSIFSQLTEINLGVHDNNQGELDSAKPACNDNTGSKRRKTSKEESFSSKGKGKADESDGEVDEESSVLRSLFEAHGIHSAMNHDVIMNANDEEKMRLEEEASQVAQRAAEALRQSRMLRSQERISIPTWTGRSGAAGAPPSARRTFGSTVNTQLISTSKPLETPPTSGASMTKSFGAGASVGKTLTSSELLARIRGTQVSAVGAGLEHQLGSNLSVGSSHSVNSITSIGSSSKGGSRPIKDNKASSSSSKPTMVQPEILIRQLCTFMQEKGGSTSSASIVEHFKDKVPSKDLPLFKNLLKEIASLERGTGGSKWVLKTEYQQ
ncbi:DNA excision repair protein CSB [Amborella trichopoda]|uniref:Uncharacterized protein n=1 Tax=Amborella trichopoda TaxID=13333 RepID=U5DEF9_AMBTC|nr:DNA excision repair protein CSB [Amborella trichopoda]ERN18793.1 hypothetical protein AMTR_s00067p00081580 [Amborella trichopoda]|eukprot:XP_006857326.1 DNA excision repair protein CSB [Amborella trichopoda]